MFVLEGANCYSSYFRCLGVGGCTSVSCYTHNNFLGDIENPCGGGGGGGGVSALLPPWIKPL